MTESQHEQYPDPEAFIVLFPTSVFDQQAPPTLRYSIQTAFVLFSSVFLFQ